MGCRVHESCRVRFQKLVFFHRLCGVGLTDVACWAKRGDRESVASVTISKAPPIMRSLADISVVIFLTFRVERVWWASQQRPRSRACQIQDVMVSRR